MLLLCNILTPSNYNFGAFIEYYNHLYLNIVYCMSFETILCLFHKENLNFFFLIFLISSFFTKLQLFLNQDVSFQVEYVFINAKEIADTPTLFYVRDILLMKYVISKQHL